MRGLVALFVFIAVVNSACAASREDQIDREWAADRVREALRQRTPILGSPRAVVVPTAAVAEGIHAAVVGGFFGERTVREQRPFHAVRSGDYWVVYGSLPPGMAGGTAVTVIRARDGAVLWLLHEA
jgi:hypothetical protein